MARTAIVLYEEAPEKEQFLLARTLDFFGVPWKMLALSAFPKANSVEQDSVVFGSASAVAIALEQTATVEQCLERRTVFYAYSSNDRSATERGIRFLLGDSRVTVGDAPDSVVPVQVSSCPDDEVGPMAGIGARVRMRKEDAILAGIERLGIAGFYDSLCRRCPNLFENGTQEHSDLLVCKSICHRYRSGNRSWLLRCERALLLNRSARNLRTSSISGSGLASAGTWSLPDYRRPALKKTLWLL